MSTIKVGAVEPYSIEDYEWSIKTSAQSKQLIFDLITTKLNKINFKNGDMLIKGGLYICIDDFDETKQDKIWGIRPKANYTKKHSEAYINHFTDRYWIFQLNQSIFYEFDPIIFDTKYESLIDKEHLKKVQKSHERREKIHKTKIRNKKKKLHILKLKSKRNKKKQKHIYNCDDHDDIDSDTPCDDIDNNNNVCNDDIISNNANNHCGKKRKRNEIDDFIDIDDDINGNSDKYFDTFLCYNAEFMENILLINDGEPLNKKQKLSIRDMMNVDDEYEANEWWNNYKYYPSLKRIFTKYYDPGIRPMSMTSSVKYKKTCYPSPPVYDLWVKSAKDAPFPYIVNESILITKNIEFIKKILYKIWKKKLKLISNSLYVNNIIDPKDIATKNEFYLSEIFTINDRNDDTLKKWCKTDDDDDIPDDDSDITEEDDDDMMNNNNNTNIADGDHDINQLFVRGAVSHLLPFKVSNISMYNALENDLKIKLARKTINGLYFMNKDLLLQSKICNIVINTLGSNTKWKYNVFCSYIEVVSGEENIKIWDVETSIQIQSHICEKQLR